MRSATHVAAFAAIAICGIQPLAASAQNALSADQIINQLLPINPGDSGFRGIKPAMPSPGSHAVPPKPTYGGPDTPASILPSARRSTNDSQPSVNLNVEFRSDSAELTPKALGVLDQLGHALSSEALSSYRFRIEGHTDTVGNALYNKRLSDRRAQAVRDYIGTRYRIDLSRLEAVGFGKEGLLVPTEDGVAEPRNRRVQVVNLGA